jgi:hypothetical protein
MPSVVVIGTLDTKGAEYALLCERIRAPRGMELCPRSQKETGT